MSAHVFVVASGFGKRVIPAAAPFQLELGLAGALQVTIDDQSAIVRPDQRPADARSPIADVVDGLGNLTAVVTLQCIAECLPFVSDTHGFLVEHIQQGAP